MTSNAGQKGAMNGDKTAKDKGPAKTFTGVSLKSGAAPAEKSFSDGKYAGELRAGKRDGEGTHVYSWGGIYTGQWKNDKKHGRGKICDKWGGNYEGDWVNDRKEGRGVNLWSNGRRYEGQWKNDEMHGEGRWRWPDGRTFQGKFTADCPTKGLLLEGDEVHKVSYSGSTDIADPSRSYWAGVT
jgi:hypothetical protein